MANKRLYWLKLKEDFFNSKEMKKLRKVAGGDAYVIIYLKMQLLSLKNGGKLYFDGIDDDFASELALELDEEVENVRITLAYLERCKLLECISSEEYFLPAIPEVTVSETKWAEYKRQTRKLDNVQLVSNTSPKNVTLDIDKDIDLDLDLDTDIKDVQQTEQSTNQSQKSKNKRFVKPTVEEVRDYCIERKNNISAQYFYDYYEANGWKVGKNPMKDWKATVRNWERRDFCSNKPSDSATKDYHYIPPELL